MRARLRHVSEETVILSCLSERKSVQIGGIVMFNNLFYYVNNFVEICIDFFLYMLSIYITIIIILRKKIGICKNRYRQVRLPKKSESAKKIAIGASLVNMLY